MKKSVLKPVAITVLAIFLVCTVFYAARPIVAYTLLSSYWGQRHSVLYTVDTVHVKQDLQNDSVYYLTYDVTVKNWPHDLIPHTYKLSAYLDGGYGILDFEGESDYFTTSREPQDFEVTVRFDVDTYYKYLGTGSDRKVIEEVIRYSKFTAEKKNGREIQSAMLYMNDNPDAEIIFE